MQIEDELEMNPGVRPVFAFYRDEITENNALMLGIQACRKKPCRVLKRKVPLLARLLDELRDS